MRRSRRCALASAAARSQAGLWRAVMQALGQRVGSHRAVSGCAGSGVVTRLRQSAVAGSKKQSASGPTWKVRATLASMTRRRARSARSEEHTSELQSLMRISYAVFCLKEKKDTQTKKRYT